MQVNNKKDDFICYNKVEADKTKVNIVPNQKEFKITFSHDKQIITQNNSKPLTFNYEFLESSDFVSNSVNKIINYLDGITTESDEKAIIDILKKAIKNNTGAKIIEKLGQLNKLDLLLEDITGEEYEQLLKILPKSATTLESAKFIINSLSKDLNNKNKLAIYHVLDTAKEKGFIYELNSTVKNLKTNSHSERIFKESLLVLTDKTKFEKLKPPEIIAHRGGPPDYPENTLLAINKSLQSGTDSLEIDVTVTGDNKIILWHDVSPSFGLNIQTARNLGLEPDMKYRPTFPEIWSSNRKPIYQLPLKTVKENFGYTDGKKVITGDNIPTLEQVLELSKKYPKLKKIYLDVKLPKDKAVNERFSKALKSLLENSELKDKIVILNNDKETLFNLKRILGKGYHFSYDREDLNYNGLPDPLSDSKDNTHISIGDPKHPLTKFTFNEYYETLKKAKNLIEKQNTKQRVIAWTINDEIKLRQLITLGIDGIMTDDPAKLNSIKNKIFR